MRRSIMIDVVASSQMYVRGLAELVVALKFFVEAWMAVVGLLHFCLPTSHSLSLSLSKDGMLGLTCVRCY